MAKELGPKLFTVPSKLSGRWGGVVTTDGVSASWHLVRSSLAPNPPAIKTGRKKSTGPSVPTVIDDLVPKHYGCYPQQAVFSRTLDMNIVAIDPGICKVIDAVRVHANPFEPKKDSNPLTKR